MQFFISTFIIMLICIIALLKDESYDNGAGFQRSSNKFPLPGRHRLAKCNNIPNMTLEIAPQLIIDKNESQTKVFATLLTERFSKPSVLSETAPIPTKGNIHIQLNKKKNANPPNAFCFQCGLKLFMPMNSYFPQHSRAFQD
jgi:hypothetical protein